MNTENSTPCCDGNHIHKHIKKDTIPPDGTLHKLADLFKTFGDPTRIRILYTLATEELCVCDIAETLSMTQSAISHQLRVLKQMDLVRFRREGKTIYYSLADSHVATIMANGLEHINEA